MNVTAIPGRSRKGPENQDRAYAPPAAPGSAVIVCSGVWHSYGPGKWANQDISLSIAKAELVCVLGPNGAGKTTLIRQITGGLRIDRGQIEVAGVCVGAHPERAIAHMGVIPQQTDLFDGLTVAEHLSYFAGLKGLRDRDIRGAIASIADELDLGALLPRRAGRLSGGQRRLVLLGLAMLGAPPLLVLDEPTTGLDPSARERVWAAVARIRNEGTAILLTTHYLEEAEALADRVGFIVEGQLLRIGTVAELCGELGKAFKVISGTPKQAAYFDTMEAAQAFIQQKMLIEFSVAPTSLRDIYDSMVGTATAL